jgi:hypothetical protein
MSEQKAACCGCGWTGTMDRAQGHISECVKYAERWQDDPHDECLDPGTEWERRQRELEEAVPADEREAAARKRAENIRKAGVFIVDTYAEAVLEEDWKTLDYDSVQAWRAGEFGMFRLTVEARRETAWLMLEAGQALPEIAEATGADERTIRDDLAGGDGTQSAGHAAGESPGASPAATVSDDSQVSTITVKRRKRQDKKAEKARAEQDAELANRVREQAGYLSMAGLEDVTHEQIVAVAVEDIAKQVAECVCAACGNKHRKES